MGYRTENMAQHATNNTDLPLLTKYGFDAQRRRQFLTHFGLAAVNEAQVQQLSNEIIRPHATQIIDAFYRYLTAFPAMRPFLSERIIPSLKRTQEEYLRHFALDITNPYYFEYRLRIGIAHERVGLPLDIYLAASQKLSELIIDAIPANFRQNTADYTALIHLIDRVAALDMALAIETYMAARFATLSESITDLQVQQQELTVEIQRDALTGAHSRRYVLDHLERMLQSKHRQSDLRFCLAMIDLDYFKKVNDTHGHLVGDRLLHLVTATMKQSIRNVDILGRYGGEEFLVILPDIDATLANTIAERIRNSVSNKPYRVDSHTLSVTVSIGICSYHPGDSAEQLIQQADAALYAAKHAGRNCVRSCK